MTTTIQSFDWSQFQNALKDFSAASNKEEVYASKREGNFSIPAMVEKAIVLQSFLHLAVRSDDSELRKKVVDLFDKFERMNFAKSPLYDSAGNEFKIKSLKNIGYDYGALREFWYTRLFAEQFKYSKLLMLRTPQNNEERLNWNSLGSLTAVTSLVVGDGACDQVLGDTDLDIFAKMPGLRKLKLNCFVSRGALERLGQMTQLVSLTLGTCYVEPKDDSRGVFTQFSAIPDELLAQISKLPLKRLRLGYEANYTLKGFENLCSMTSLRELGFTRPVFDASFQSMTKLSNLYSLTLGTTTLSMEGAQTIAALPLQYLSLYQLQSASLIPLFQIATLRQLFVEMDKESDAINISGIANLINLEALGFSETNLAVRGLDELSRLTNLRWLQLESCWRFRTFSFLEELQRLEMLDVSHTSFGNKDCSFLRSLPLRVVYINSSQVSDKGLALLSQNKMIEQLFFKDGSISKVGLKKLKNLPHLHTLDLEGFDCLSFEDAKDIIPQMTQVKNLGLGLSFDEDDFDELAKECTNVKHFINNYFRHPAKPRFLD